MEESYKYNNVSFIIKRNPRQESKEEWLESDRECCKNIQHPRDGKTVYTGQTFRDVTYSLPIISSPKSLIFRLFSLNSYLITSAKVHEHSLYQVLNS